MIASWITLAVPGAAYYTTKPLYPALRVLGSSVGFDGSVVLGPRRQARLPREVTVLDGVKPGDTHVPAHSPSRANLTTSPSDPPRATRSIWRDQPRYPLAAPKGQGCAQVPSVAAMNTKPSASAFVTKAAIPLAFTQVAKVPCVDGSELARRIFTSQGLIG